MSGKCFKCGGAAMTAGFSHHLYGCPDSLFGGTGFYEHPRLPAAAPEVVSDMNEAAKHYEQGWKAGAASQSEQIARLTRENELLRNRARALYALEDAIRAALPPNTETPT